MIESFLGVTMKRGKAIAGEGLSEARDVRLLTEYLSDRDCACPLCGYNLRGLHSSTCPECSLRLQLVLHRPNRFPCWIAGLAGLASGLGFWVFLMVAFIIQHITLPVEVHPTAIWRPLALMGGMTLVLAVLTYIWIGWAGRIDRMSMGWQRTLSMLCFVTSLALVVVGSTIFTK